MMLSKTTKLLSVYDPTTGTSTGVTASSPVDCAGFSGCCFVSTIGNCSTAVTMTVQAATSTTAGDFATITKGTSDVTVSSTEANRAMQIDVYRPLKRYLRVTWNSTGASNTGGGITARLYGASFVPTTNASTDVVAEAFVAPTS